MADQKNNTSLRAFAKSIGVSHSTLSKIANNKYGADTGKVFKKILSHVNGVVIPADKYDEILAMLNDAKFPKFGETSRTASWLYDVVETALQKVEK